MHRLAAVLWRTLFCLTQLLAVLSFSSISMASIIGQSLPLFLLLATSAYSSPTNSPRAVHITDLNNLKESYDYVIIGGGTSGLTVADRLTEDPKGRFTLCPGFYRQARLRNLIRLHLVSVLVVEYGPLYGQAPNLRIRWCELSTIYSDEQEPGTLVPGIPAPQKYYRNYQSVPQPGLGGRSSPVFSAAVVGGATVINGMFFNRGTKGDYDAWEQLGNPGWGWQGLLPYFKKVDRPGCFLVCISERC